MLGIFLLYFIVTHINKISAKFGKKKWPYAILSLVVYYGSGLLVGVIFGLSMELSGNSVDAIPDLALNIAAIPFGVLAVWAFGKYLNNKWDKEVPNIDEKIEEFGKPTLDNSKDFE